MIDLSPPLRRRAAVDNRHIYVRNDPHLDVDGHDEAARELVRCLRSQEALALDKNRAPGTLGAAAGTIRQ